MPDETEPTPEFQRYARQVCYKPLGQRGQQKLSQSSVLICGCGALGSVLASTLARAGVGHLRIVDRDFLELNNLQRQILFDEQDVAEGLPKAIAAANKLRRINSQIEVEPVVADVDHRNVLELADGVDLLLDGTDNFETRMLLNDVSARLEKPWIYGGCVGAEGQTMTILPGRTACLRCLMREPPPPEATASCDTAGILGSIVNVIASIQAAEAIKILSGNSEAINPGLTVVDLWDNRLRQVGTGAVRDAGDCPTCSGRETPWLDGQRGSQSAVLCGRNSVQLRSLTTNPISLEDLASKLADSGRVIQNKFLLRVLIDQYEFTIFPDGRAIVGGTDDVSEARTVFARYIGS
jgi:adenylyltransferase/sulfurtransferase